MFQIPRALSPNAMAAQEASSLRSAAPLLLSRLGLDWTFIARQWRWIVVGVAGSLCLYLAAELTELGSVKAVLALGVVAHDAVLMALGQKRSFGKFAHAAEHALPDGRMLVDSYHCSRYNTQTRRLTAAMFVAVIGRARELIHAARP